MRRHTSVPATLRTLELPALLADNAQKRYITIGQEVLSEPDMSATITTHNTLLRLGAFLFLSLVAARAGLCEETTPKPPETPRTFAVETFVDRTYNYLDSMVDKDGLPYFDVFWIDPAEAAHDWPDFGNVTSRQLQGAIMARHLTGREARNEKLWLRNLLSYLDPETGLIMRPKTSFTKHVASPGDQALTLYALVTAYADTKDPAVAPCHLQDGRPPAEHLRSEESAFGFHRQEPDDLRAANWTTSPRWIRPKSVVESVFDGRTLFTPDNNFRRAATCTATCGRWSAPPTTPFTSKTPCCSAASTPSTDYMRSRGTRFGFMAEVVDRKGDVISCETCTLMDFIGIAVTLANNGHPEYWGDVERMVRNQLVESQVTDASWLTRGLPQFSGHRKWDRPLARYRPVHLAGGWGPNGGRLRRLVVRPPTSWPPARTCIGEGRTCGGKTRAFQNCCGGSGTHAFFIAWKNAARFHDGTLSVNLHIDKLLPEAEIRCYQPYKGLLTIDLKQAVQGPRPHPRIRRPGRDQGQVEPWRSPSERLGQLSGTRRPSGRREMEVTYPLPVRKEETTIGNPGFRQYRYRVTWKGDTVVRMTPARRPAQDRLLGLRQEAGRVFYGDEGPGRLYQRDYMLEPADPPPGPLHMDDGFFDCWFLR